MKKIFTICSILLISSFTFAQEIDTESKTVIVSQSNSSELAEEGTFYFEPKDKRYESFTSQKYEEIRRLVKSNRHNTEQVTISIGNLTNVIIPSKQTIENPSFIPYNKLFLD